MIGRLRGILLEKQAPHLLLEAGGVGYELMVPMTTFYHLPDLLEEVMLHTHLVVREDAHQLYGFYREQDRRLFRALIKINGIGPKLGLTVLSRLEPDQFVQCIHQQNVKNLSDIPGIGKKTAERLLIEMRDVLAHWQTDALSAADAGDLPTQDAISALVALGYKLNDAQKAIRSVTQPGASSESLIRLALQQSVKGDR
jgi:Holliday junction DNA helicase RuvA